jgi:NADH dehydrogenase (ubiquinone) 1 alpha subcomplex subunit 4
VGDAIFAKSKNEIYDSLQILPIYVLTAAGLGLAAFYVFRLATKSPEVTWSRVRNPEPWNEYRDKQYKVRNVVDT